jgi:2'-hydroxyisoflavone reductase
VRLLLLGGTQFVGRHLVDAAVARGHTVTLFNRGQTNPKLFPRVEAIRGDRDLPGGMDALKGRKWDAVIDVNCYIPRWARASAAALRDSVDRYYFVSTGSVYDFSRITANADESAPLEVLKDPTTEVWMGPAYGGLKVLCENAILEAFPGRALITRLGVQAGPYDPTDRVTYWVTRVARGGEILVPGTPDTPVQFCDARDTAAFGILALEKGFAGIFNTLGRSHKRSEFLDACVRAAGAPPTFTYVPDFDFLMKNVSNEGRTFGALPMSVPPALAHIMTISSDKALAAGLSYRSAQDTARDVLAWDKTRPASEPRVAGLRPDEEQGLLAKWKARSG